MSLASLADDLALDRYLRLGRGELETGGAQRPSLLAAAFEALVGAVYLSEGLDAAERAFDRSSPAAWSAPTMPMP